LHSSLFSEQSEYHFNNVTFKNIKTNSDAMIKNSYNYISFKNCVFEDILCNGDIDDSSLLKFNSNNITMDVDNVIIKDCITNSDLVKFLGNELILNIHNSSIQDISSYGSIMNNNFFNVC